MNTVHDGSSKGKGLMVFTCGSDAYWPVLMACRQRKLKIHFIVDDVCFWFSHKGLTCIYIKETSADDLK